MDRDSSSTLDLDTLHRDGFYLIRAAVDRHCIDELIHSCESAFESDEDGLRARSSRGHVYAARNLLTEAKLLQTFWQTGPLADALRSALGDRLGLVRVLYFDKPPDRTWSLPWHKDLAIAVNDNSLSLHSCSRPTTKAGVPHVVACDEVLTRMLTLRIHLDDVTDENGPLQVIAGSHFNRSCEGVGAAHANTIYATAGDVLAMRPLVTHCSGASMAGTQRHRRILHLEFAADHQLPDRLQWHDFIPLKTPQH